MPSTLAFLDGLGGPEVLVIGVIALLMFGSKRLPELGRAFGRAMREFKRATSGVEENLREVFNEDIVRPQLRPPPNRGTPRSAMSPAHHPSHTPKPSSAAASTPPASDAASPNPSATVQDSSHPASPATDPSKEAAN